MKSFSSQNDVVFSSQVIEIVEEFAAVLSTKSTRNTCEVIFEK